MSKLTVWNPWRVMPRDFFDLDSDISDVWSGVEMDMYETKDSFVVKVKAADYPKDGFDIEFKNNSLVVTGKAKEEIEEDEKDKKYYRKEIKTMSFTRTIDLPVPVKTDDAKASYKDGVLTITMPKSEEAKPKKLTVSSEE